MIDELADMNYAHCDPQYFDEEAAHEAEVKEAWIELKDMLDEVEDLIKKIVDMDRTEDAIVTCTLISGALCRAERNAE